MNSAIACFVLMTTVTAASSQLALTRLAQLKGHWTGTFAWTGARTDHGVMDATYTTTGNGTAVVETLLSGDTPMMTTVYHLDGADLRMTHYCAARNQPRLKADSIDLDKGMIDFDFVDATNLASPAAPHVHGFAIHFVNDNEIELQFRFTAGGKESLERIALKRKVD